MKYFTKTYENGLRLIFEKSDRPVVACQIMVNVGSQDETSETEGYAHLLEHMTFKSSKNYQANDILDKLATLGTDYNAYTSKTFTNYVFKSLSENFEESLKIYSDIILNPKYLESELEKEKEVIIEEMKRSKDDPIDILVDGALANYYDGSSIAHDVLGTEETIKNATPEKMFDFRNKFYVPQNMIVSIVGNFEFETIENFVSKFFASQMQKNNLKSNAKFDEIVPNIKQPYLIIDRDDQQANVLIMLKGETKLSEKRFVANVYSCILGASSNSRLFKEIREKMGLVYSICAYCESNSRTGDIAILFGTRPNNVKKAITKIKEIIDDLAQSGITKTELKQVLNLKKSNIAFAMEKSSELADFNSASIFFENEPLEPNEIIERYSKVTLGEVNDYAKKIKNEKLFSVTAIGKNLKIEDLMCFRQNQSK